MSHKDENVIGVEKLKISPSKEVPFKQKRRRSSAVRPPTVPQSPAVKPKKRKNTAPPTVTVEDGETKKRFTFLRDFALFALNASDECPEFVKVTNRSSIEKVVTILIPNIPIQKFGIENNIPSILPNDNIPKELKFLKEQFDQLIVTTAPGNKHSIFPTMNAFIQRPLNKKERKSLTDRLKNEKMTIPRLKMTLQQLHDNKFPIHPDTEGVTSKTVEPLKESWVDTKSFEHEGSHTFAIDCEMCESANGKVLARFSMVDFNGKTIFDELVKPDEEITDYLTPYSGITEIKLKDVTTTLKDIQEKFLSCVSSTDYLIGHSLENDLNVLKIRHPNIVDTSLIFEHPRGPPFKSSLKYITNKYLEKVIQEGSHDSIEDSKSCLDLVKLKLVEGGLLGKVISNTSVSEDIRKVNKNASIIDFGRVQPNQSTYIQCSNDDSAVDSIIEAVKTSQLVIGNLREIEHDDDKSDDNLTNLFTKLNERLEKIYESIPNNTALIISSGHGDLSEFNRLKQRKELFGKEYSSNNDAKELKSSWTLDDEQTLVKSLDQARIGITLLKLKTAAEVNPSTEAAIQ